MKRKIIFEVHDFGKIKERTNKNSGGKAILTQLETKYIKDNNVCNNYLLTELDYKNKKVIRSDRYSNKDIETYGWNTVKDWVEEDMKRYEEYGINWHSIGIIAEAKIFIPFKIHTNNGFDWNFKIQEISSGGIWGVESDSQPEYFESLEEEQIAELEGYLNTLNVDLSFWKAI